MDRIPGICYIPAKAPYPRGKGEVCKTFMHRFESGRRLFPPFLIDVEFFLPSPREGVKSEGMLSDTLDEFLTVVGYNVMHAGRVGVTV